MNVPVFGTRFKSVNRSCPCPFCDHTDWCFFTHPDDPPMPDGSDGVLIYCQRVSDLKFGETITGSDGDTYVCVGNTSGGATVFEAVSQYIARHPNTKTAKELGGTGYVRGDVIKQKPFTVEKEIQPLSSEQLNRAYSIMVSMFKLDPEDREKLHRDGMTDDVIAFNQIVSLPEPDAYRFNNKKYKSVNPLRKDVGEKIRKAMGGSIEGIPGLYYNSAGKATIAGLGGILYPQYDLYGNIVAMRIGVKRRWKDDKGNDITKEEYEHAAAEAKAQGMRTNYVQLGKYMNLASYAEDRDALQKRIVKNRYLGGCRSGNHLGFYKSPGKADLEFIYITEGEKKAMIAADILNSIVVDVPGVNSHTLLYLDSDTPSPLSILKAHGNRAIIVAYDADKNHNEAVLKAQNGLVDALSEMGFGIAIAEWDEAKGKGLDDFLVNGGTIEYHFVRSCSF